MAPLGLQMTTIGSLGGGHFHQLVGRGIKADLFFELGEDWEGWGTIKPLDFSDTSITVDNNDAWDIDGTDITPAAVGDGFSEGFWEVDSTSGDLSPIDV